MTSKRYSQIISSELYRKFSKTDVFEALESAVNRLKGEEITEKDIEDFIKEDKKARSCGQINEHKEMMADLKRKETGGENEQ